ncbi:MAG: RNA polymerase subunit sigma-70, partial [Alcanivoracaceae bacterium]|nr:RNA polymerase subunit sigma-70 [Alcanivoracaceae bacterium]
MSTLLHLKLLSATALNDRKAFEELYKITCGKLYAVSYQLLQHKDLAEDALQDAYVKIWHNAAEYRKDRGTVLTWMTSITRYRALDILRARKSRKEL